MTTKIEEFAREYLESGAEKGEVSHEHIFSYEGGNEWLLADRADCSGVPTEKTAERMVCNIRGAHTPRIGTAERVSV